MRYLTSLLAVLCLSALFPGGARGQGADDAEILLDLGGLGRLQLLAVAQHVVLEVLAQIPVLARDPDGLGQLVGGNTFDQVAGSPGLHGLLHTLSVVEAGQGQNPHLRVLFSDGLGRLHAIHTGHDDVEQDEVRVRRPARDRRRRIDAEPRQRLHRRVGRQAAGEFGDLVAERAQQLLIAIVNERRRDTVVTADDAFRQARMPVERQHHPLALGAHPEHGFDVAKERR